MEKNYIDKRDRIISTAIQIISARGMSSLTIKNIAAREHMPEEAIYRYFTGIDEILLEILKVNTKFDDSMISTVESRYTSHLDRAVEFIKLLVAFYSGYPEMAAVSLHYEELLHNVNIRDYVTGFIVKRKEYLCSEFTKAIEENEIVNTFQPDELFNIYLGSVLTEALSRRIIDVEKSYEEHLYSVINKFTNVIRIK